MRIQARQKLPGEGAIAVAIEIDILDAQRIQERNDVVRSKIGAVEPGVIAQWLRGRSRNRAA